jgi:hypothetical protein
MNTTRNKNISPPACAAAIISVQRAKHQTSRFEELANLPFKENRRTKETAQTLRDKLHAPAIIAAAIRLPTGDAGRYPRSTRPVQPGMTSASTSTRSSSPSRSREASLSKRLRCQICQYWRNFPAHRLALVG